MKRLLSPLLLSLCLVALGIAPAAHALPPAVETDRLLLEAKTALDKADALSRDAASSGRDQAIKEQYQRAASAFENAEALGTKLPSSVPYHHGVALAGIGKLTSARDLIGKYLEQGTGTKFYADALAKYNQLDNDIKTRQDAYAKALRDYQTAKNDYGGKIASCVRRLTAKADRLDREVEQAHDAAEKCSEGWSNALNMATGGQDRCARFWDAYNSKRQRDYSSELGSDDEEREQKCKERNPEPKPPAAPEI